MGLDTVELIIEVEEAFGIEIPDRFAERMLTVGDLYDFVIDNIEAPIWGNCLSASTFLAIRKSVNQLGVEKRFGPSSKLVDVLPETGRRKIWHALASETGLQFPDLVLPDWLEQTNFFLNLLIAFCVAVMVGMIDLGAGIFMFFLTAVFGGSLISAATRSWATEFGSRWQSFRGLTNEVVARNAKRLRMDQGAFRPKETWEILTRIVVEVLGVDVDEVTHDARFVEDLGLA